MKKIIILFSILVFDNLNGICQRSDAEMTTFLEKSSEKELIKESIFLINVGYLADADKVLNKLLINQPDNANFNYRKGYVELKHKAAYQNAIPYLQKASNSISKNYDMYSVNEKDASTDVYFYLGECYHKLHDFENAKKFYTQFSNQSSAISPLVKEAKLRTQQCDVAKEYIATPTNEISIINLGENVNSNYPEYASTITPDGSALYFTSRKPWGGDTSTKYLDPRTLYYPEDIYVSFKNGNTFGPAKRLALNAPESNEATIAVNADSNQIYTYNDHKALGDIQVSYINKTNFEAPTPISIKGVNSDYWDTHITSNKEGTVIYFVSDRPGGLGGRDIYQMTKNNNGKWSNPKNLGPKINTEYEEDAPFISADGKKLFFASNGPKSMGGFDIFYTEIDDKGEFSEVKNLGYPINSCEDDLYYSSTKDGKQGYFSSARAGGFGEKDIYNIANNNLGIDNSTNFIANFKMVDGSPLTDELIAHIACKNCTENTVEKFYPAKQNAEISYLMEDGKNYTVSYDLDNEDPTLYSENIELKKSEGYQEIKKTYIVDPTNQLIYEEGNAPTFKNLIVNFRNDNNKISPNSSVEISCNDCGGAPKTQQLTPGEDGKSYFPIKPGKSYSIKYLNDGKINKTETITAGTDKDYKDILKDFNYRQHLIAYTKYFGYNIYDIENETELKNFVSDLKDIVAVKQELFVEIIASASKVPTNKFKSNNELAQFRAEELKEEIQNYIQKMYPSLKVNYTIKNVNVNGPAYSDDATNIDKYKDFQFAKAIIK